MCSMCFFFFFNDTATTEIYTYWHTLSLHDALPIFAASPLRRVAPTPPPKPPHHPASAPRATRPAPAPRRRRTTRRPARDRRASSRPRSEEHTSELQPLMRISYAVFCLKKKKKYKT